MLELFLLVCQVRVTIGQVKNLFQKPHWYMKHQWENIWQISLRLDTCSGPMPIIYCTHYSVTGLSPSPVRYGPALCLPDFPLDCKRGTTKIANTRYVRRLYELKRWWHYYETRSRAQPTAHTKTIAHVEDPVSVATRKGLKRQIGYIILISDSCLWKVPQSYPCKTSTSFLFVLNTSFWSALDRYLIPITVRYFIPDTFL